MTVIELPDQQAAALKANAALHLWPNSIYRAMGSGCCAGAGSQRARAAASSSGRMGLER